MPRPRTLALSLALLSLAAPAVASPVAFRAFVAFIALGAGGAQDGGAGELTRVEGHEASFVGEGAHADPRQARRMAHDEALTRAAEFRKSTVRFVSFLHMDGASVEGASDLVLRADADLALGRFAIESESVEGGLTQVRGRLVVPRAQVDPTWRTAQLVADLEGEALAAALWAFVNDASVRDDAGAMEHGLRVLLQETAPDAKTVSELVSVHQNLGEWNDAYLVLNTYLDRVPEADRPALQRLLDRGKAEDESLRLKLYEFSEYVQLDGIQALRVAKLAEQEWNLDAEFERELVQCFAGGERPWIVTYRHRATELEFSLVPANQRAGAALPALVARTECSEQAFGRGAGQAAPDGGMRPVVRVTGTEALDWCTRNRFTLPELGAWRYYASAGGFSSGLAAPAGGELMPADPGVGERNGFGLQGTVGNVWEWCLPEAGATGAADWPLAGGSYRDPGAAGVDALRENTPRLKRPDVGFRPVRPLGG